MDLLRIPAQLVIAWSMHTALTPPNPPAAPSTQVVPNASERVFKRTIRLAPLLAKSVIWIPAAADILLVLVKHDLVPHTWRTPLCELLTGQRTFAGIQTFITPAFLAGTALCVLGCRFRSAAYAALGRHFTFELALARDQPLVTTYPYSVVRHPAYIGGFVGALGADLALYAARGGWVREALVPWVPRAVAGVGLGALVGLQVLMIAGLSARVPGEDRIMREHFGREWEEWARRVPYKLIPGVY